MFDLFFLMLAAAIQAAGPKPQATAGPAATTAVIAAAPSATPAETAVEKQAEAVAAPAFLAPAAEPAAAPPPAFLAPAPAETAAATAAPAFLAPSEPVLQAEPQVPSGRFTTATEVKPILAATRGNWIHVRDFNGQDLVYVTHLWSWRCGLLDLKVGINGAAPEPWPLPPCHLDHPAPNAIFETDGLPYRSFARGAVATVEIQLTYDDLSTESATFNRQGQVIQ